MARSIAVAWVLCVGCAKPTQALPDASVGADASADAAVEPAGRSISEWTACDGVTDDSIGAAAAFQAASGGAFTLLVDCPLKLHIGSDIARPIYVDNGTTVTFWGPGKIFVDNLYVPAFVLANTSDVTFTNWNVEWDGSMPISPAIGNYYKDGVMVALPGGNASGIFNDTMLTPWLAAHRGIVFDQSMGGVKSQWPGPVNISALFVLSGDTSNVNVTGMHLYAPATAGGSEFIPFCFSFVMNFKSNQTVTATTPTTAQYRERPHGLLFSNIDLDGTYMAFQGSVRDATFEHIHSGRYGDVQDASGGNSGGVNKFFPPPHLFYLNYSPTGDPALFNTNITIHDVVDDGTRVGTARDKGGTDTVSGYALSLKLGCHQCSVDGYKTARPDGFMDVLSSDGLTVSNVVASYDSVFLNGVFPGWRFSASAVRQPNVQQRRAHRHRARARVGPDRRRRQRHLYEPRVRPCRGRARGLANAEHARPECAEPRCQQRDRLRGGVGPVSTDRRDVEVGVVHARGVAQRNGRRRADHADLDLARRDDLHGLGCVERRARDERNHSGHASHRRAEHRAQLQQRDRHGDRDGARRRRSVTWVSACRPAPTVRVASRPPRVRPRRLRPVQSNTRTAGRGESSSTARRRRRR